MEDAYTELYREFLRLRSLCLKQAVLLQQLSTALQTRQGPVVTEGGVDNMVSIPVQCTQESPVHLHEGPEPLIATAQHLTQQNGVDCFPRRVPTFSDLLAEDMGNLCLDVPHQRKEDEKVEHKPPPFLAPDLPGWNGASASSCVSQNPRQADHPATDGTLQTHRMPWACGPFLDSEFLSQTGGMFMSELALQSQVCEFCQAVFPGDTATRGAFLRHLYTHIT
ncbi:uncharacterized protein ACJ7VT_011941 isoform 1-T3 [Polymixia lowei]